jgi:hypothetical protein
LTNHFSFVHPAVSSNLWSSAYLCHCYVIILHDDVDVGTNSTQL